MLVKDIRFLREFFKSNVCEITDEKRNPHFAGYVRKINDENEYGFFNLYHGVKPDVENLLKTILEMARDSQAVYEFMQNAVDAESTEFALFPYKNDSSDQHYLVVLNNGKPFDLKGVLAILNIGAGTKFRDPHSIGQFGVGFKLAHRLVGEETGLNELMKENKGPILFSWENHELQELADKQTLEPGDREFSGKAENVSAIGRAPWLLKILYTNFPCLPDDDIVDVNGVSISNAFTKEEFNILTQVAKDCCQNVCNNNPYKEGSLLLIPLHSKKVKELTEESERDGLEYSTAILNERSGKHKKLERTFLNGHVLETAKPKFESFRLTRDLLIGEDGKKDQQFFEKLDRLEIDFCYYTPFETNTNPFAGKPQFYLYFPMTEERHGFWFALHCNAFSFASSRTALQENTERNKRIFKIFIEELSKQLQIYIENHDDKFLELFAILTLSKRGDNNQWKENRTWLEQEFWEPLMTELRKFIPVMDKENGWSIYSYKKKIAIKNSLLPIENWIQDDYNWFYWSKRKQWDLCECAKDKFEISELSFFHTLQDDNTIEKINEWLTSPENDVNILLNELQSSLPLIDSLEKKEQEQIWDRISKLKIWSFNNNRFSIDILTNDDYKLYLIKYGPIVDLETILTKAGFVLSSESLEDFPELVKEIRNRFRGSLPYLYDFKELNILLGHRFVTEKLSASDKKTVFETIIKAVTANNRELAPRIARMRVLSLFNNKKGDVKPLQELIGFGAVVPEVLKGWLIDSEETEGLELNDYTSNTQEEIYEEVILKNWSQIISQKASEDEWIKLFAFIVECHAQKPAMNILPQDLIKLGRAGLVTDTKFFYHEKLTELDRNSFESLEQAAELTGMGALPLYGVAGFYKQKPFLLSSNVSPQLIIQGKVELTEEQARALSQFCIGIDNVFLNKYLFTEENGKVLVTLKGESDYSYYSEDSTINQFIHRHYNDLKALPTSFKDLAASVLKDGLLLSKLIELTSSDNEEAFHELVNIVHEKGDEAHIRDILKKAKKFLITSEISDGGVYEALLKICFVKNDISVCRQFIEGLVTVKDGEEIKELFQIDNRGSDKILLNAGEGKLFEFSISQLLGENGLSINKQITDAALNWTKKEIVSTGKIEAILKLQQPPAADIVFDSLKKQLIEAHGGIIQSASQLGFVLLYGAGKKQSLKDLKVETHDGPAMLSHTAFYFDKSLGGFIPGKMILSEKYSAAIIFDGTDKDCLLELGNCVFLQRPFIENTSLKLPGISEISKDNQPSFFNYLFELWKKESPAKLFWAEEDNKWDKLIGYRPQRWVLPKDYGLQEEFVPEEVKSVIDEDDALLERFLISLGANDFNSDLVIWRRYLAKDRKEKPPGSLTVKQALRTLKWIYEKNLIVENNDLFLLYQVLERKIEIGHLPVPVFSPHEKGYKIRQPEDGLKIMTKEMEVSFSKRDIKIDDVVLGINENVIPEIGAIAGFWPLIQKKYPKLEIQWSKVLWNEIELESEEWNTDYYNEWKKSSGYRIFKTRSAIIHAIVVEGKLIKTYREGDVVIEGNKKIIYVNGELATRTALEKLENEKELNPKIINDLKTLYLNHSDLMQQTLETALKDKNVGEEIKRLLDEISNRKEREERASRLIGKPTYTLQWFQDLLEFVKVQQRNSNAPEIEFTGIRKVTGAEGLFELFQASGNIPANLDTFDSVSSKITYRQPDGKSNYIHTSVEISLKHQKLWARFPSANAQPVLQDYERVISVRLVFSRTINLIEELKLGFETLGYEPTFNLKTNFTPNIKFLFGPPGTGKTTEVAKRLIKRMEENVDGPVIVLTPTNKAADVLAKKIIDQNNGDAPYWLRRYGTCIDPVLTDAKVVVNNETVVNRDTKCVVITTVHRFTYDKVQVSHSFTEKTRLCNVPWSMVVFDEASMIPIAYAAFSIHVRQKQDPSTEFLVAGDPLQIPPVFDLDSEDLDNTYELQKENIYTMVGLTSFDSDAQAKIPVYGKDNRIENLTIQHRSIPIIGQLFSEFQYGGKVGHSRGTALNPKSDQPQPLPAFFKALGFKPITIIRYKVQPGDSIYNPRRLNDSPLHIQSALLATEIIKKFNDDLQQQERLPWTVGIISPYRAQASLIDKLIEARVPYSDRLQINIDTVHGFQGDENRLVIAVLNPGNANAVYSRFLKEQHILNVAISRAEDYLILFVPDEQTEGLSSLRLIHEAYNKSLLNIIQTFPEELRVEFSAQQIELALLQDKTYFENNSFTTSHLPVNVYGEPRIDYMFRVSGNAVDVHWRKK